VSENRDGVCEQALKVEMYVSYLPLMRYFGAYLFLNRRKFFQDAVHMRLIQASQVEAADFYDIQLAKVNDDSASYWKCFFASDILGYIYSCDQVRCIVRIKCILTIINSCCPAAIVALRGSKKCPKSQIRGPAVWFLPF
jgi:hypothetical protein